jgi:hypothetical protein
MVPMNFSNIEFLWELPSQAWFLGRLASFSCDPTAGPGYEFAQSLEKRAAVVEAATITPPVSSFACENVLIAAAWLWDG